jgi:hypothetical protein
MAPSIGVTAGMTQQVGGSMRAAIDASRVNGRKPSGWDMAAALNRLDLSQLDGNVSGIVVHSVLNECARHANPDRDGGRYEWFVAVKRLARDLGLSPATVYRALKECERLGWIEQVDKGMPAGRGGRQTVVPCWRALIDDWPRRTPTDGIRRKRRKPKSEWDSHHAEKANSAEMANGFLRNGQWLSQKTEWLSQPGEAVDVLNTKEHSGNTPARVRARRPSRKKVAGSPGPTALELRAADAW